MAFAAARAARCSRTPIHFDGYARLSYASCAGPSTRDPSPLDLARPNRVLKWSAKRLLRTNFSSRLRATLPPGFAASDGLEDFTATKAIAAAADNNMPAVIMRRCDARRFWLNQPEVFIIW